VNDGELTDFDLERHASVRLCFDAEWGDEVPMRQVESLQNFHDASEDHLGCLVSRVVLVDGETHLSWFGSLARKESLEACDDRL